MIVSLPLAARPDRPGREGEIIKDKNGDDMWLGFCLECIEMFRAALRRPSA